MCSENGQKLAPGELFDPSNRLLARVFRNARVFPAGSFATPRWLTVRSDPKTPYIDSRIWTIPTSVCSASAKNFSLQSTEILISAST